MPRCNCAGSTCACKVQAGAGVTVTGIGTASNPYVVTATIGQASSVLSFDDTPTIVWTISGDGTPTDPLQIEAAVPRQKWPIYPTSGRPSASVWGEGSFYYDSTLDKPLWSNGSVWKDAAGTTV